MASEPLAAALARHRRLQLEGLPPGGLALLLASAGPLPCCLWIAADEEGAEDSARLLRALGLPDVVLLPGGDHSPLSEVGHDPAVVGQAQHARRRLAFGPPPAAIVASAATVMGTWPPHQEFVASCRTLRVGVDIDRRALVAHLTEVGYQAASPAHDEGTFCVRGGVIDIFVPGDAAPHRLDLFGDTLAGLTTFSPATGQTVERPAAVVISPAREVIFGPQHRARAQAWVAARAREGGLPSRTTSYLREQVALGHYFFGIESLWPIFFAATEPRIDQLAAVAGLVVIDGGEAVAGALAEVGVRDAQALARAEAEHRAHVTIAEHQCPRAHLEAALSRLPQISAVTLALHQDVPCWPHSVEPLAAGRATAAPDPMGAVLALARPALDGSGAVVVGCGTAGRKRALQQMLAGRGLQPVDWPAIAPGALAALAPGSLVLVEASLPASLRDRSAGLTLIGDGDIFPAAVAGRGRRRLGGAAITSLQALAAGSWVIHRDHGIGRYEGLVRLVVNGVAGDYLHLRYAGDDKLYLPVYNVAAVRPYRGPQASARADRLGGGRWQRAQARVKDAVLAVAHQMLAAQAARQARRGFALPPPDHNYAAFAASFAHEETADQARAIAETLADLQRPVPMDRLLCADVGFGKTEVALRATFVAVFGGRQVLVLVPTTVLAEQHRATFAERLEPFGARVEVLSRFQGPSQQAATLRALADGSCDVVIGTHRLLSADVVVRRLGLLVVDEEQRFGVKHKERLKRLSHDVHILSMSATPIPRTMHMAMTGLRDLSIIQTPPASRSSIRTEVLREDFGVVADAVRREMHRGGQAFVVYNRVRDIARVAAALRAAVPEARVLVAHGQMPAEALERIMVEFVQRRHDVLVATAIIESGIDIPSVNTMIVLGADAFGLSQLHQLRGRIGRGNQRAYAYLMLPGGEELAKPALERLAALKRFGELGAGFQLASYDLELRGAGDLLGAEQSGHVAAVGLELYSELLNEAIERARGAPAAPAAQLEPDIKLPVAAVLPESYVPDPTARLAVYQRLADAADDAQVFDVVAETASTWGEAPPEVVSLAEAMVIRRRLRRLGAAALSASLAAGMPLRVAVTFTPGAPVDRNDLLRRCQVEPERYRLTPTGRLGIHIPWADGQPAAEALPLIRHALGELRIVEGDPPPAGGPR